MPMNDTEIQAAISNLAKVQPQQPRKFVIAGKSSERTLWISIAATASATMSMVEQPFKSGFSWRVMGEVHKQQGKYIFAELDSAGAVREAELVRAINTQLKAGGASWPGDKKISTLPALWMPRAQAQALADQLGSLEGPSGPPTTSTETTTTTSVVEESADPFDAYADAFAQAQSDIFASSEDLHKAVQRLAIVLVATKDPFLKTVAEKNLVAYLDKGRTPMLNAVMMVGVAAPKERLNAMKKAKAEVVKQQDFIKSKMAEIEAMEKHQPPTGSPVSFAPYQVALQGMSDFCDLMATTASSEKWFQETTTSSGTSGTSGTTSTTTS